MQLEIGKLYSITYKRGVERVCSRLTGTYVGVGGYDNKRLEFNIGPTAQVRFVHLDSILNCIELDRDDES